MKLKEAEDYIAHYGTRGMKWGVRNTKPGGSPYKVVKVKRKDLDKETLEAVQADKKRKETELKGAKVPKSVIKRGEASVESNLSEFGGLGYSTIWTPDVRRSGETQHPAFAGKTPASLTPHLVRR